MSRKKVAHKEPEATGFLTADENGELKLATAEQLLEATGAGRTSNKNPLRIRLEALSKTAAPLRRRGSAILPEGRFFLRPSSNRFTALAISEALPFPSSQPQAQYSSFMKAFLGHNQAAQVFSDYSSHLIRVNTMPHTKQLNCPNNIRWLCTPITNISKRPVSFGKNSLKRNCLHHRSMFGATQHGCVNRKIAPHLKGTLCLAFRPREPMKYNFPSIGRKVILEAIKYLPHGSHTVDCQDSPAYFGTAFQHMSEDSVLRLERAVIARASIKTNLTYITRFGKIALPEMKLMFMIGNKLWMQAQRNTDMLRALSELLIAGPSTRCCGYRQREDTCLLSLLHGSGKIRIQVKMTVEVHKA